MKRPNYQLIYADAEVGEEKATMATSEWEEVIADLKTRELLTDQRKRMVDRLVRDRVEYEFLYPEVAARGAVDVGVNGGQFFDLNWSVLDKLKVSILKMETVLKIPPSGNEKEGGTKKPKTMAEYYFARNRGEDPGPLSEWKKKNGFEK